jgi:hypothetical protein
MNSLLAWAIVGAAMFFMAAVIFFLAKDGKEQVVTAVIAIAGTLIGVFVALAIDNAKRDKDDNEFAKATLYSALITLAEEMRPWHDNARHFPELMLKTPDNEQQKLFYKNFAEFTSLYKFQVPQILSNQFLNVRTHKSLDTLFLVLLAEHRTRLAIYYQALQNAELAVAQRYAAYHQILKLSGLIFAEICVQAALLNNDASRDEFERYFSGGLARERLSELGCIPRWNARSLVNDILRRARIATPKIDEYVLP